MKVGFRELLFLVLLAALPLGAYGWVFKPANERVDEQRRAIEAKSQKLTSLRKAMGGIKDLNEEVDKLRKAMEFFEAKLPKNHEIHRVLEQVTKIARRHGLDTKLFKTLKASTFSAYAEQPIEMEVAGDFDAYYQFLLDLEKLPRITKVKQMELAKDMDVEGSMKATLSLVIFFDNAVSVAQAKSRK